jgi:HlyD family secretion protein
MADADSVAPSQSLPNKIFRQSVRDRLSSPEQLDLLMRVTDARGWLALGACGVVLAAAVTWGIWGRIPSKVEASGILIPVGGLAGVVAMGDGQLTSLEVEVGDRVRQGQVIARIAQPELAGEIEALRKQKRALELDLATNQWEGSEDARLRAGASTQQRATLRSSIAATRQREHDLEERLASQETLLQKGLVTQDTVQTTRQQLRAADASMQGMEADFQKVAVEHFSAQRATEGVLQANRLRIGEVDRQLELLAEKLAQSGAVLSPHAGRVVELRAATGDVVHNGSPIASLERTDAGAALEALLYVDSRAGKAVRAGMIVEVAPTGVRRERHGAIVGHVRAVEDFPSTHGGMMRILHNEQLVEALLAETAGAPMAVRATLDSDARTPTGYRWTSGRGPDTQLTSGTRLVAYVVTHAERPLALVFPILGSRN